jgi:membrane associated rhomboid family serine protease
VTPLTPWVQRLLVANIAVFLLTALNPRLGSALALVPALLLERPWTLVTYMFVHAGLGHLFFNMLALYFFGPRLELRLGSRSFLGLYMVSGVSGALLSFVLTPYAALVGASGAIFGVMLGFARLWPRERIYIWGVLPVEAWVFILLMALLSLFGGIGLGDPGVAHFAHLGGIVGGYAFLRWAEWRSQRRLRAWKRASR